MHENIAHRLQAYAEARSLHWRWSVEEEGKYWRAKVELAAPKFVYGGTGFSPEEAVDRAITSAIQCYEEPARPSQTINLSNARLEGTAR